MRLMMAHPFIPTRKTRTFRMTYDIANMRIALQQQISPRYSDGATGQLIRESFKRMRVSNDRLAERSVSKCLIPLDDGNGGVLVDCKRATANSHAIQEKVLQRIAADNSGGQEVLDFMDINTARIANECQGPNGELWQKKALGHREITSQTGTHHNGVRPGISLAILATTPRSDP